MTRPPASLNAGTEMPKKLSINEPPRKKHKTYHREIKAGVERSPISLFGSVAIRHRGVNR